MPESPYNEEQLDFRVARILHDPWITSEDGQRNIGNLAKKAGVTPNDLSSSIFRLKKTHRID